MRVAVIKVPRFLGRILQVVLGAFSRRAPAS